MPAVVVCTELFEPTAKQMAELQGVTDFPMVLIPHPLGRCPVDELEIKAEIAVDAIARLLLQPAVTVSPNADQLSANTRSVEDALGGFAASLQADGFHLAVESVDDSVVTVALTATDEACHDCLVADDMIIQMLTAAVQKVVPDAHVALVKKHFA
ncbi:MAG: hypothetical protein WD360_04850 [Nitriliruptoraceae bacterium]